MNDNYIQEILFEHGNCTFPWKNMTEKRTFWDWDVRWVVKNQFCISGSTPAQLKSNETTVHVYHIKSALGLYIPLKYDPQRIWKKSFFQSKALDQLYNLIAPVVYECARVGTRKGYLLPECTQWSEIKNNSDMFEWQKALFFISLNWVHSYTTGAIRL